MAINKKLIHFRTFENFNSKKLSANEENTQYTIGIDGTIQSGSPDILYQSIVYIKDTKQQWTHGLLYNGKIPEINQIEGLEEALDNFYGECNIPPSTVDKTVTTLNGGFILKKGAKVSVKFLYDHTASIMTLNVDGTGAKNVYRDGNNLTSNMIKASNIYDFVYDGNYWRIVGVDTNTTYSNATQSADGLMSSADKVILDSVGNANFLQTENKTSIVLAINEINAKTIKNNNSVLLFSGFMTDEDRLNIKNENYDGDSFSSDFYKSFASYNPFSVYYNEVDNHFYYKDESFFYYNWDLSYLYNTSDELSIGRNDVIFSYNNQHYIVINGILLDISAIEKTIKTYTNNVIDAKIVYLPNQAAYDMITPIDGVLYLIGDEVI